MPSFTVMELAPFENSPETSLLLTLDAALKVLPGHGPDSTLGEERRRNPFLQDLPEIPA